MVDVARERAVAGRVGVRLVVHRHGQVGAAVVRVVEHRDGTATRVLAGDLHAVLDGLGARVHEHRLLLPVAGRVLGEELGDAHVLLVGGDREERVDDVLQLAGGRGDDALFGVPDRRDADAGAEVDELVAVDVDEDRAVRALDVHGQCGGDAGRDDLRAPRLQLFGLRTGDGGHDLALLRHGVDRGGGCLGVDAGVSHGVSTISPPPGRRGRAEAGENRRSIPYTIGGPMLGEHHYEVEVEWQGDRGVGTAGYRAYGRQHLVRAAGKTHAIEGSSDRTFHGDRERWNPEELLLAALSECHMLSYLHVATNHGVIVRGYTDQRDRHDGRRRSRRRCIHRGHAPAAHRGGGCLDGRARRVAARRGIREVLHRGVGRLPRAPRADDHRRGDRRRLTSR